MGDQTAAAVTDTTRGTFAVLLTFRRPDDLARSLDAISAQSVRFDELVVVDNDPSTRTSSIVERYSGTEPITYVASPSNLGPAGGRSLGAREIMQRARDDDWVVFLDDDDPLASPDLVERLMATVDRCGRIDPRTAGVGLRGARLDRWTGRLMPVNGRGIVRVDHLHGNCVPCYRLGPLRHVGLFDAQLFFGFEELELGMRLRRAGFTLFVDTDLFESVGPAMHHAQPRESPDVHLAAPSLRRYYALRNRLVVLGRERLYLQGVGWALFAGLLKPAAWLVARPRVAWGHLRLNATAIWDAATGRLGPRRWTDRGTVARP